MISKRIPRLLAMACLLFPALVGCSSDHGANVVTPAASRGASPLESTTSAADEVPVFDPANFIVGVNHTFFPLVPGTIATFQEGTGPGAETVVVEVLAESKTILGIQATVVRDRVYVDGELIEDTDDWYAQDRDGNVWYLGEVVKNYEGGVLVSTDGSWEAGQAGATAGIQMLAEPEAGVAYDQEFAPDIAEDEARVRRTDVHVDVPFGSFDDCVQVLEWTKLEPGHRGYKYYARNVGLVLESSAQAAGRSGRVELISVTGP